MNEKNQYIKFMSDIIDSGIWAELSAGARTLYPVLLKFSDQNFKHVWPSTSTLMRLTGFKTKKSIIDAKKELISAGLIQVKPGTGHSNSVYYFCFNYKGSKIKPLWDTNVNPLGIKKETPEIKNRTSQGSTKRDSNKISITITNNNQSSSSPKNEPQKDQKKEGIKEILELFGHEIFSYAYSIALKDKMEDNLEYIKSLCKKRAQSLASTKPKEENAYNQSNWDEFLFWASKKLSKSSYSLLSKINPIFNGSVICIEEEIPEILKQIIQKYFVEHGDPEIVLIFSKEKINETRI